jgi:hypothetical protein
LADQVAEQRRVASIPTLVRRKSGQLEQLVDSGLVKLKLAGRDARLLCNGVARLREPGVER